MEPRHVAAWLVMGCAVALASGPAHAQDDPRKRVTVLRFVGPQAGRARAAVVGALERRAEVVDEAEFARALEGAAGPTRPDRIAAACRALQLDAVVEGAMSRARRAWGVEVVVRNCDNGEKMTPGGRAVYSMRNLGGLGAVRASVWSRIGASVLASGSSGARLASREPEPGRRRRSPPTEEPAPRGPAGPCLFEEDEPPEGFPGHGDWVRRRNAFLIRCDRDRQEAERRRVREIEERRRRAQEERVAEERRRRAEEERQRRAEEDRRRRAEEDRRRADLRRRAEQERARVAEIERRRIEEESLAAARAAEERRREDERLAIAVAEEEDRRRREQSGHRELDDLEQRVAAYRERLRRERGVGDEEDRYGGDEELDRYGPREDEDRRFEEEERRRATRDDRDSPDRERRRRRDDEDRPRRRRDEQGDGDGDGRHQDDTDDSGTREVTEPDPDEETAAAALAERRRKPAVLNIGAGVAFMNRSMSVEVTGSDKPRSYSAPGYPELTVSLEFFPIALASPTSGAAGLGVFGLYRRHLFLQTSGPGSLGENVDVATAEQELLLGAMFRTVMGRSPSSPSLTLQAGYGYFAFELDPIQMSLLRTEVQMPTMIYKNFAIAAGIGIPLSRSGLALEIGGQYRYVVDVGQGARDLFGDQTAGGHGFGAHLGLGGEAAFIAEGLIWSLSGDYFIFQTDFGGTPLDGDAVVDQFGGGTDAYIRGLFLAGYRFR